MSFRAKIILMSLLAIGGAAAAYGAGDQWGAPFALGVVAVVAVAVILLAHSLLRGYAGTMERMSSTVAALVDGKIEKITDALREPGAAGALEVSLAAVAIAQQRFATDLENLAARATSGEGNLSIDNRNYPAGLRDMAAQINTILQAGEAANTTFVQVLDGFAKGDFTVRTSALRPNINASAEKLAQQLQSFKSDVIAFSTAIKVGNFSARAANHYAGEWAQMAADMNAMPEAAMRIITDIQSALERMETGNFSSAISGMYHGEFAKLKETVMRICKLFTEHFNELSSALDMVSRGREVSTTRDYRGAFSPLQSAVLAVSRSQARLTADLERAKKAAETVRAIPPAVRPTSANANSRASDADALSALLPPADTRPRPRPKGVAPPITVSAARSGRSIVPSGAHEYDRKDYGKYK